MSYDCLNFDKSRLAATCNNGLNTPKSLSLSPLVKSATSKPRVAPVSVFTINHMFVIQTLQNQFSLEFHRKQLLLATASLFKLSIDPRDRPLMSASSSLSSSQQQQQQQSSLYPNQETAMTAIVNRKETTNMTADDDNDGDDCYIESMNNKLSELGSLWSDTCEQSYINEYEGECECIE